MSTLLRLLVFSVSAHALLAPEPFLGANWMLLKRQTAQRFFKAVPFANSCFLSTRSSACNAVQAEYTNETARSDAFGAYINTQWETCQATGDQCLLDYTDPRTITPSLVARQCEIGSIPNYFVNVQSADDVAAAFDFAKTTHIPIVIKNTGHDYRGRSSGPGALALWTHNLKNMSYDPNFVPEGCAVAGISSATIGAGVQWGEAYAFAESQNITLVGGNDAGVGVSGGWAQGGGHGVLANTMGLGVDRVLQFKIITPDGRYRVANACQHSDLFFALRGGGGGTFGVVIESTILASPPITIQVVAISFKWAEDGWGGAASSDAAIYVNPILSKRAAAGSLEPLIAFGQQLENSGIGSLAVLEFPTFGKFFDWFVTASAVNVGVSQAIASRLVNKANFRTESDRSALLNGLLATQEVAPRLLILLGPPSSFRGDGRTSVTDAWRESVFHVTVASQWNWNATIAEKRAHYATASRSIDKLRDITPDAAYQNEADLYEPNHEVAFWGRHYPRLVRIKRKYDPQQLLDCWQCVGWNPASPRFACYL